MSIKIYYWCPFIDKVATIKSVLNSAYSLKKYNKFFEPIILDICNEWQNLTEEIKNRNIGYEKLTNSKILKHSQKKRGFFYSRILYLKIILLSFMPLIKFLKKETNDILLIHLITSLPLLLSIFLNKKKKIILRISGLPKLNFARKIFWNIALKKIELVLCPTEDTRELLKNVFPALKEKFLLLRDPILDIKKIQKFRKKNKNTDKYFISIGRLTKQKNYELLLNLISYCIKKNKHYNFIIVGEGEKFNELKKIIDKLGIDKHIKILPYTNNIFPLLENASALISTSLWEDPGFTLIEAGYVGTVVISSSCPNGPLEIINNNKNGYIFKNNNIESLIEVFEKFTNDSLSVINLKKFNLKKKVNEFTIFQHYKNFSRILNNEK